MTDHANVRSAIEVEAPFLAGGGETGALIRQRDWSASPLGPVSGWPQSLRTSVSICLNSEFPLLIWWGRELVMIYNDAYREVIGGKHPLALGRPGVQVWPEIWPIIGPMLAQVLDSGQATISRDLLLMLERHGYAEECYFTFSYSPIIDESGAVGGVFTPVIETTGRVVRERRHRTLRELADATRSAPDTDAVLECAGEVLEANPFDVPFALFYRVVPAQRRAVLASWSGVRPGPSVAPAEIGLEPAPGEGAWVEGLRLALRSGEALERPLPDAPDMPSGAWRAAPRSAMIVPVRRGASDLPAGFAVCALNPHRKLDPEYRNFLDALGRELYSAVANAESYAAARERAEALAEIDRAKTAFFTNVSHEFRTPLTLILEPLSELAAAGLPAAQEQQVEVARRNARRLLRLVSTLLNFSRIEAGRLRARYQPTDLAKYTADLAGVFRSAVERAGMRYRVDCRPLSEPVYVDREMWEQVVLNLLSNAFKFTLRGEIALELDADAHGVRLEVRDTGPGIPAADQARVFERFFRRDQPSARSIEGSGIGLSLVRDLIQLHGGEIELESVEGRGSVFRVRLPLGSGHLPPDQVVAETSEVEAQPRLTDAFADEAQRWLPEQALPAPAEAGDAAADAPAPDAPSLLVADDNADMRAALQRMLSRRYRVRLAANGREALQALRAQAPDLLLADVMMPELDGFGLLEAVRADPALGSLPVILLSARAGEEEREEGLALRADDYVVKPFRARELHARIDQQLALHALRSEVAARARELEVKEQKLRAAERLRESEERFRQLTELSSDWYWEQDEQLRFTFVSPRSEYHIGRRPEDLIGRARWELDNVEPDAEAWARHRETIEAHRPFRDLVCARPGADGALIWYSLSGEPIFDAAGRFRGYRGVGTNITARKQAEDALRTYAERERILAELSLLALRERDPGAFLANAAARVRDALSVDFVKILELTPGGDRLALVGGVGWREGLVGRATVPANLESQAGYALYAAALEAGAHKARAPVIVEDIARETRFRFPELLRSHGARSGISVVLYRGERPCGVLGAHARESRRYREDEAQFLQSVANIVAAYAERARGLEALHDAGRRLSDSERQLRAFMDHSPEVMFIKDDEGRYVHVNSRFLESFGVGADAVLGRRDEELFPPEQAHAFVEHDAQVRRSGRAILVEESARYVDGDHVSIVSKFPIRRGDGTLAAIGGIGVDVTERKRAETALHESAARLQALAARLVSVQEEERRRLARELHDRVGQNLTALDINLGIVQDRLARGARAELRRRLADSRAVVEATAKTIEDVMADLRPPLLDDYGLAAALRGQAEEFSRRTGIAATVAESGEERGLRDPEIAMALFRIVQEALNNVAKHARAKTVRIGLDCGPREVSLRVADDGVGFEAGRGDARRGWGMTTMRERVEAFGGRFAVESSPGAGTTVSAAVKA